MAVQGVVGLVGATVGFATLANLTTASLLRDLITRAHQMLSLGLLLALGRAAVALPFALSLTRFHPGWILSLDIFLREAIL